MSYDNLSRMIVSKTGPTLHNAVKYGNISLVVLWFLKFQQLQYHPLMLGTFSHAPLSSAIKKIKTDYKMILTIEYSGQSFRVINVNH